MGMINRGIDMTASTSRKVRRTDIAFGRYRTIAGELKGSCIAKSSSPSVRFWSGKVIPLDRLSWP